MIIFFVMLTIAVLFVSKAKYGNYFTPLGFYAAVWGGALIIYYANPLGYIAPYPDTDLVFIISYVGFVAGCLLVSPRGWQSTRQAIVHASSSVLPTRLEKKQPILGSRFARNTPSIPYVRVITYLGFAITCIYFVGTVRYYGWDSLFSNGSMIRMEYLVAQNQGLSLRFQEYSFWFGLPIVYAAAVLNLVLLVRSDRLSWNLILPLLSALMFDLSTQGRQHTFNILIFYGSGLLLLRQINLFRVNLTSIWKQKRYLIYIVAMCFALFVLWRIGYSRNSDWEGATVKIFNRYDVPVSIVHVTSYFTGSLSTFNVLFNLPGRHELWWGGNTFYYPILRFLYRYFLPLPDINKLPPSALLYQYPIFNGYGFHNTYSYLRYLWDDWGYLGLVLGPLLLGYLSSKSYCDFKRKYSPLRFCYLLIFMNVIGLTFGILNFANHTITDMVPLIWLSFYFPQKTTV